MTRQRALRLAREWAQDHKCSLRDGEAAKAKIRHPFKVKVTVVPRSEARCPHFLWSDGRYDYDFGVERRLVGAQILLFRGYIRRRGLGFNQKYKERMRKAWRR